jgi:hypothetical protein
MDTLLAELKQALEASVEGFSTEQMSWHPAEKWCAAEVLEHLYLTYTGTVKGFDRVLNSGKPLAGRASMKQRWRKLFVLGFITCQKDGRPRNRLCREVCRWRK